MINARVRLLWEFSNHRIWECLLLTKFYKEVSKMSLFDEDEMECEYCGHIGMVFNGGFDVECLACGARYSLIDEDEE